MHSDSFRLSDTSVSFKQQPSLSSPELPEAKEAMAWKKFQHSASRYEDHEEEWHTSEWHQWEQSRDTWNGTPWTGSSKWMQKEPEPEEIPESDQQDTQKKSPKGYTWQQQNVKQERPPIPTVSWRAVRHEKDNPKAEPIQKTGANPKVPIRLPPDGLSAKWQPKLSPLLTVADMTNQMATSGSSSSNDTRIASTPAKDHPRENNEVEDQKEASDWEQPEESPRTLAQEQIEELEQDLEDQMAELSHKSRGSIHLQNPKRPEALASNNDGISSVYLPQPYRKEHKNSSMDSRRSANIQASQPREGEYPLQHQ